MKNFDKMKSIKIKTQLLFLSFLFCLMAFGLYCGNDNQKKEAPQKTITSQSKIDFDGDGFDESKDCNDKNPSVHPGAEEICDAIDSNCNKSKEDHPQKVKIKDPVLAKIIAKKALKLNEIPKSQMFDCQALHQIEKLFASPLSEENPEIKNLNGIEALINLQKLDLSFNSAVITNYSPLAKLPKLKELSLRANRLDLSANHHHSSNFVASLKNKKSLKTLLLNEMESLTSSLDISALKNFQQLEKLDLSDNSIKDISALNSLINLKELYLGSHYKFGTSNKLTDISVVAKLKKLEVLSLRLNQITDVSALANLTKLKKLKLDYNEIADITPLISGNLSKNLSLNLHANCLEKKQIKKLKNYFANDKLESENQFPKAKNGKCLK